MIPKIIKSAIVTNFIHGRIPKGNKWNDVSDTEKSLCEQALHSLNAFGVFHKDARIPNFIVQEGNGDNIKIVYILDFGFSEILTTRPDYLEQLMSRKSEESEQYSTEKSSQIESIGQTQTE